MRGAHAVFVALLFVSPGFATAVADPPRVGDKAPDFTLAQIAPALCGTRS
jgi:hypothetical protein